MNDDEHTLQLRPLAGSPWVTQYPAHGSSLLDLRGLLPADARILEIRLNGAMLKHRVSEDHRQIVAVPLVPLEAGRLDILTKAPRSLQEPRKQQAKGQNGQSGYRRSYGA